MSGSPSARAVAGDFRAAAKPRSRLSVIRGRKRRRRRARSCEGPLYDRISMQAGPATPESCSFRIAMICSSPNRERFIRPSPLIDGLYQNLDEVQGLRSLTVDTA